MWLYVPRVKIDRCLLHTHCHKLHHPIAISIVTGSDFGWVFRISAQNGPSWVGSTHHGSNYGYRYTTRLGSHLDSFLLPPKS